MLGCLQLQQRARGRVYCLFEKRGIDISKHINNSSTNTVLLVDVTGEVENVAPVAVANPPTPVRNLAASFAQQNTPGELNPKAFLGPHINKKTGEVEQVTNLSTARSYKKRAVDSLQKFLKEELGNSEQQNLALYTLMTERAIAKPALNAIQNQNKGEVGIPVVSNIKEVLDYARGKAYANDSKGCLKTLFVSIATTGDPCDKTTANKRRKLVQELGAATKAQKRTLLKHYKEGVEKRGNLLENIAAALATNSTIKKPDLIQHYKRKSSILFVPEFVDRLHKWISQCKQMTTSPKPNDTISVKNLLSGEDERVQKQFIATCVREMWDEMVLPVEQGGFDGARDANGKIQISDTMLRNLMPRHVSPMTDTHMELCGCENCNISKHFVHTLNKWVTNYVKWLKNEAEKPENSDEKTDLLHKAKIVNARFKNPDGTNKYDHPRQIVDVMTCPKVDVGDGRMIHRMECCLGR